MQYWLLLEASAQHPQQPAPFFCTTTTDGIAGGKVGGIAGDKAGGGSDCKTGGRAGISLTLASPLSSSLSLLLPLPSTLSSSLSLLLLSSL